MIEGIEVGASPRPRLAPSLARRIDRLARAAHLFHRYAHHPLCDRYGGELIALGRRTRICRGCSLALAGGLLGLASGMWVRAQVGPLALLGLAPLILPLTLLKRRLPKGLTRFLPAAALGLAVLGGTWPVSLEVTGLAGLAFLAYRGRGPDRSPCHNCPERTLEICRGFRPLVRRERAFQRVAGRLVDRAAAGVGAGPAAAPIDTPGRAPL